MRKTDSIQVITFDLDNTLWDVEQTIRGAEKSLRAWMGEHTPGALDVYASAEIDRIRAAVVSHNPTQRHDLSFLRTEILRACMLESGLSESEAQESAEAAFDIFFVGRNNVVFFDNALKVLDDLSQEYRLFALTNGNADIQRVGIGQFFQGAVSSADVGASKPDPAMFSAVLTQAKVQASAAVHIGDHLSDDILGANRAGMHSIWFNRDGTQDNNSESKPSAEVQSLEALPESIARLL